MKLNSRIFAKVLLGLMLFNAACTTTTHMHIPKEALLCPQFAPREVPAQTPPNAAPAPETPEEERARLQRPLTIAEENELIANIEKEAERLRKLCIAGLRSACAELDGPAR